MSMRQSPALSRSNDHWSTFVGAPAVIGQENKLEVDEIEADLVEFLVGGTEPATLGQACVRR